MSKKKVDLNTVKGILKKVGANFTDAITEERAVKKLERYIQKDGIPVDLSEKEAEILIALGLAELDEGEPKPETKGKKEPKAKAKAKRTSDWMTCAAEAILSSRNLNEAGKKAAKAYLKAGGRATDKMEQNSKLYVSFASKALIVGGVITLDDGKIVKAR